MFKEENNYKYSPTYAIRMTCTQILFKEENKIISIFVWIRVRYSS